MSSVVLLSEIGSMLVPEVMSNEVFYYIEENKKFGVVAIFGFCGVFLTYIAMISYVSIFSLRYFGFFGFWPKATDPVTLLNTALYLSKMTPPMLYNFIVVFFGHNKFY